MQNIFEQQQERAEREAEKNRETYRTLIHRLAGKGSLSSADQGKLFDTMALLAIPLHQADTDVKTLVELARLETVISAAQEAADAMPAVTASIKVIDDEQIAALDAFAQRRCPHLNEQARLSAIIAKRENAEARRDALREANRDLLNLPDPTNAKNCRHLVWRAEGKPAFADDGVLTLSIEDVMASAQDIDGIFAPASQYRLVLAEGQRQEELDLLAALAREIVQAHAAFGRPVRYAFDGEYDGPMRNIYVNASETGARVLPCPPTSCIWIRLPSQTPEDMSAILTRLEKFAPLPETLGQPVPQKVRTWINSHKPGRPQKFDDGSKDKVYPIIVLGLATPTEEKQSVSAVAAVSAS